MKELSDVSVGDILIINRSGDERLTKIDRLTKTQIITKKQGKFNRNTGRSVGGDNWTYSYVNIPRAGDIERILENRKKNKLCIELHKTSWKSFDIGVLTQIVELVNKNSI